MLTGRNAQPNAPSTQLDSSRVIRVSGVRMRVITALQSASGGWLLAGLALALSLPALALGFSTDDHVFRYVAQLGGDPASQFSITASARELRSVGALAWWSSPALSITFLRPLTLLTHVFEYRLWPDAAWAMHLANALLYTALVAFAWALYRALFADDWRTASVAALMFVIDEAHAPAVGWISSRSVLLANLFGFAAIYFHVRSRKLSGGERVPHSVAWQLGLHGASALCLALALLSAEAGVSAFAYLIAYAIALESGSIQKRAIALAPQLVVLSSWAIFYVSRDYGAHAASFYRDSAHPASVLWQGMLDLPTWLLGLFGPSFVGAALPSPAGPVRIVALVLVAPLIAGLALALPRSRENLFFALGALFSLPPFFTTQPQDRLLMGASFGALGLVASFLAATVPAARFARVTRNLLIAIHLVIAPLLFVPSLGQTQPFENSSRSIAAQIRAHAATQVVIVNTPIELLGAYATAILAEGSTPRPASIHQLYAGGSALEVERVDTRTLEVRVQEGWGARMLERIFCAESDLPHAGTQLEVEAMAIRVMDTDATGHPLRVRFQFNDAVDAPQRLWLSWQGKRPWLWKPPALGETVKLEPLAAYGSHEM